MSTDDAAPLSRSILAATDRPHMVRARRWKPRQPELGYTAQWDRDVVATLESALYLERRRKEKAGR